MPRARLLLLCAVGLVGPACADDVDPTLTTTAGPTASSPASGVQP